MCFMGGGGGSSAPAEKPTSAQETAAIQSQQEYRKQRLNRLNAYDGFATDLVGKQLEPKKAGNDNVATPSGALKKLMGA